MPRIARLRVLGTTELTDAAGRSADAILAQPKRLALLAHLRLARPAGFRRREQLLALFWPELDERRARSALSQALHRIRLALGADVLLARGPEEVGVNADALACDVAELDEALAEGRLDDALALFSGELLPALSVPGSAAFDEWLDGERQALRDRVTSAVREAMACAEREGRLDDAIRLARRQLELAPYDEPALRRTMELLARAGDHAGAIRCHDEFAARLRRELELEPAPETAAVVASLRASRATSRAETVTVRAEPSVATAPPAAATSPPVTWPGRRLVLAALGLGAALVAMLVWKGVRPSQGTVEPASRRVLVLPFTVRGDSSLAYLSDGMVELLSASLEGLADVQAVDPHVVLLSLRRDSAGHASPAEGAELARRLGASSFVLGDVIAIGGRLETVGVLYDADGTRRASLTTPAVTPEALPAAIDDLARQVVASRLTGPAERLSRLATLTTDSLAALRAYLDGERARRHGQFGEAAEAYRRAVAVDSLFALAWFRLGVALEWVQATGMERRAALDRAAQLGARLSERDRMLVRAAHAYSYGSLDEAEALGRQLVTAYPEDVEAWYGLAEVLFHGGPFRGRSIAQAEPAFRRLLALHPGHLEARLHLMRLLAWRGGPVDLAEIDSLLPGTREDVAEQPVQTLRLDAFRALVHGDTTAMRALEPEIGALPDNLLWEMGASLATTTGKLTEAARVYRLLALPGRPPSWRAIAHMSLATLAAARGRWHEAQSELAAVRGLDRTLGLFAAASLAAAPWLPIAPEEREAVRRELAAWRPGPAGPALLGALPQHADLLPAVRLLDLAVLSALVGDTAAAAGHLRELAALGPLVMPIPGTWELPADARAAVALSTGDAVGALTALDDTRTLPLLLSYPRTFFVTHGAERWTRAEALRASGRAREAIDWYGTFTCYLCVSDLPYEAPGWLRQARLREELGEREGARTAYAMALARWRDADERFGSLGEEARAGLARTQVTPRR